MPRAGRFRKAGSRSRARARSGQVASLTGCHRQPYSAGASGGRPRMNWPTVGSSSQSVRSARAVASARTAPSAHGASRMAVQTRYRLWNSTPTSFRTVAYAMPSYFHEIRRKRAVSVMSSCGATSIVARSAALASRPSTTAASASTGSSRWPNGS